MSIPSFLVVADRGCVKAFEVERTPTRGPMPRLTATFQVSAEPDRYREEYSDRMGSFPNGATNGKGNSVAERQSVGEELQSRALRNVAQHIDQLISQHHPQSWGFAAPSEIAGAVLERLKSDSRGKLKTVVKHDLINVDAKALIHQFTEADPVH
jgi:hypothetical protein